MRCAELPLLYLDVYTIHTYVHPCGILLATQSLWRPSFPRIHFPTYNVEAACFLLSSFFSPRHESTGRCDSMYKTSATSAFSKTAACLGERRGKPKGEPTGAPWKQFVHIVRTYSIRPVVSWLPQQIQISAGQSGFAAWHRSSWRSTSWPSLSVVSSGSIASSSARCWRCR